MKKFLKQWIAIFLITGVAIIVVTGNMSFGSAEIADEVKENFEKHDIILTGTLTSEETGDSSARIKIDKVLKNTSQQKEIPKDVTLRGTNPFSQESPPVSFTETDIGKKYLIYGRWTKNLKTPEISGISCTPSCLEIIDEEIFKKEKATADIVFVGKPMGSGSWGQGEEKHRRSSFSVEKFYKPRFGKLQWLLKGTLNAQPTVHIRTGGPYPSAQQTLSTKAVYLVYANKIEDIDEYIIQYIVRYPTANQQLKILRRLSRSD
ncbi:MAG: hypothetical protein EA357_02850 [Micavibrio sp.]|nr:MAG: hypothetical protein EA357_02850 [Micavibrio sp.]